METKNTVYVVNDSGHIMDNAKKFGNFKVLSKGNVNIFRTNDITADFKGKLKDIQPTDFILLSGSSILNVLATSIALTKNSKVGVLLYNLNSGEYVPRIIETPMLSYEVQTPVQAEM